MKRPVLFLILLGIGMLIASGVLAQDDPPPPDLAISHIDPAQVTAGQHASITIYGSGFDETTEVRFDSIGPVAGTLMGADSISVNVPTDLTPGVYDVSLSSGVGNATLPDAFTVLAEPTEEPTPTNTPVPQVSITHSEPEKVTAGTAVTLSVLGSNFTPDSLVRVAGVGLLTTTFLHEGALTAELPATARSGQYAVEVIDPVRGTATSPNKIRVLAPPAPTEAPLPTSTPIPVANEPALILNNVNAQPGVVAPGGTVRVTLVVYNRGNELARNIVVALGSGSSFVPAVGQANLNLPDLPAGGSAASFLSVTAASDIAQGPAMIPLSVTYQSIEGDSYENKAELGVTVQITAQMPQIVLDGYLVEPEAAVPGQPLTIQATIANMGTKPATQVLVRVTGGDNVLLPDTRGDSFPFGNLQPGERRTLPLPLIVNTSATEGPQLQPLTISYLEDGEQKEAASSLTIHVTRVNKPAPLLLLASYDTGQTEDLRPGDRFTLETVIKNVGNADANDMLVTFGTVQTSGESDEGSGDGDTSSGGQQASTTPSTTFAPQGSGGRIFAGLVSSSGEIHIKQEFIVSGSVSSGIYTLPVTLQYTTPDNKSRTDVLNVSLVVIAPARLRINPPQPLPEMVNAGEPLPLLLELVNFGKTDVYLTSASISATNAEIPDGTEIPLETLKADGDTSVGATLMPLEEGDMTVTLTLHYLDDLNQPQSIVQTYTTQVSAPPPMPEEPFEPPVIEEPVVEEDGNWLGRGIMALLGLGS